MSKYTPPPDPLGGVKGHMFKFCNNSCQYFNRNFACRQRNNRYETYQTDFFFVSIPRFDPLGGLDRLGRGKIYLLQKGVRMTRTTNMLVNSCPYTPLDPWWGQKVKKKLFLESCHVTYQKGKEV